MKKYLIITLIVGVVFLQSCSKDTVEEDGFNKDGFLNIDVNSGGGGDIDSNDDMSPDIEDATDAESGDLSGYDFQDEVLGIRGNISYNDFGVLINGEVVGTWFAEGIFNVELYNRDENMIGSYLVQAIDDYMTTNYVSFIADIPNVDNTAISGGYLLFRNANLSGLPENDLEYRYNLN